MLVINVLGPLECSMGDGRKRPPKKALALLAYLAVHNGQPVPRDRLADLLWPFQDDQGARHSLRNCLLEIRKADHGWVESDYETCRLGSAVTSDIRRFTALHRSTDRALLAEACALYRGRFLDDLDVTSEPWNEWVSDQRIKLSVLAAAALWRLCDLSAAARQPLAAIAVAKQMVAIDQFDEPAHRRLMTALADGGRRSEALAHFNRLDKLLRGELGVGPDAETQALARQLRVSTVSTAPTVFTEPAPTVPVDLSDLIAPLANPQPRNWKRELGHVANVLQAALDNQAKLTRQVVTEIVDLLKEAAAAYPEASPDLEESTDEAILPVAVPAAALTMAA